jgi:hypothetical protein
MAAPVRDRLAMERQRLDAVMPEALDQTAEILAVLHAELRGELAALAPRMGRTDRYLRGELLGEHGMPIEDVVALHILRPAAVCLALRPVAGEPEGGEIVSVAQAVGELVQTVAKLCAELMHDLADGRLTLAEVTRLEHLLDEAERTLREARAGLIRRRP